MADFQLVHTINCPQESFWSKVYFADELNRRLFLQDLGFTVWNVIDQEERESERVRVVEAMPKVAELPGPLKALIGASIGYRERSTLDKKTQRCRVAVTPNQLADKLKIELELWTSPLSGNQCQRHVTGSVTAKIFGVGGLLERKIISDLERSFEAGAHFANQYLAETHP